MPLDNEVAWKEIGRVPSKGNGISIIRFTETLNGWMMISTTILPDASAESLTSMLPQSEKLQSPQTLWSHICRGPGAKKIL